MCLFIFEDPCISHVERIPELLTGDVNNKAILMKMDYLNYIFVHHVINICNTSSYTMKFIMNYFKIFSSCLAYSFTLFVIFLVI